MTARDRTRSFTANPGMEVRNLVISESTALFDVEPIHGKRLATASQRFAAVLRAALIDETTKSGSGDFAHVLFSGDKRPLWTTGSESDWRRYVGELMLKASKTH